MYQRPGTETLTVEEQAAVLGTAQVCGCKKKNTFMTVYNKTAGKSRIITLESIIKIDSNGEVCISVETAWNEMDSTRMYLNVIECPFFRPWP